MSPSEETYNEELSVTIESATPTRIPIVHSKAGNEEEVPVIDGGEIIYNPRGHKNMVQDKYLRVPSREESTRPLSSAIDRVHTQRRSKYALRNRAASLLSQEDQEAEESIVSSGIPSEEPQRIQENIVIEQNYQDVPSQSFDVSQTRKIVHSQNRKRKRQQNREFREVDWHYSDVDMVDNQPTPKTPKIDPSEIAVNSKNIPSALLKPLNFTALVHPREGRSDEWFQIAFTRSQQRTLRWAKVLFGFCDISAETDSVGKWSAKAGRSFLKEVDKIAVADPNGGVLDMLLDSKQRVSLVAALINNIFQDAVFDEYLFGADKEEKDLLHAMDRAFVADGGFLRTSLRSQIVRAILHTSTVTKNFESEVCSLTKRIYVMFEPLINYIFSITPLKCKEIPRIEDGWQALHNLVANTAFLSICIRLSKDAFHFVHATPDDRYDSERYSILDEEVLQKSKEVALAARQTKMSTISDRRQKAAPTQLYHLVKVSVFPEIECYKHGSGMGDTQGFRIYRIKKGTVQVYYGPKKDDHSNFIPPRS